MRDRQRATHPPLLIEMALPLDLFTDYLLDIEMLDASAADGSPGHASCGAARSRPADSPPRRISPRRSRSSGRTIAAYNRRRVRLQAIGTQFAGRDPQGSEFDDALSRAGLDALPAPKLPGLTIFWDPATPPQPAAILVDSIRADVAQPPAADADHRPAAGRRPALPDAVAALARPGPAPRPGGDNIVDHIVAAPGGQRALVTLNANSRGKQSCSRCGASLIPSLSRRSRRRPTSSTRSSTPEPDGRAVGGDGLTWHIIVDQTASIRGRPHLLDGGRRSGSTFRSLPRCRPSSSCAGC